jgi:hypothetical protein
MARIASSTSRLHAAQSRGRHRCAEKVDRHGGRGYSRSTSPAERNRFGVADSQDKEDSSTWQPGNGPVVASRRRTGLLDRRSAGFGRDAVATRAHHTNVRAGAPIHTSSQEALTTSRLRSRAGAGGSFTASGAGARGSGPSCIRRSVPRRSPSTGDLHRGSREAALSRWGALLAGARAPCAFGHGARSFPAAESHFPSTGHHRARCARTRSARADGATASAPPFGCFAASIVAATERASAPRS